MVLFNACKRCCYCGVMDDRAVFEERDELI